MTLRENSTLVYLHYGVAIVAAPIVSFIFLKLFGTLLSKNQLNSSVIFYSVIMFPIIEELTFRGILLEAFNYIFKNKKLFTQISVANIATSILFAVMHTINYPLYWALLTFIPSLIFGYFKERFDSVIPSIFLHSYYNLIFLVITSKFVETMTAVKLC